ncbi:MAG: hypothetical protein ACH350_04430 [Parachlamydiaceae bacterium]
MVSVSQAPSPHFYLNWVKTHSNDCKVITFLLFNMLTVGIYEAYSAAALDQKYRILQQRQIKLLNKQEEINKSVKEIDAVFQSLFEKIEKIPSFVVSESQLDEIDNRIGNISSHVSETPSPSFIFITRLCLNIITLGYHGYLESSLLRDKNLKMSQENDSLMLKNKERATVKTNYLNSQSELLRQYVILKNPLRSRTIIKSGNIADQLTKTEQQKTKIKEDLEKLKNALKTQTGDCGILGPIDRSIKLSNDRAITPTSPLGMNPLFANMTDQDGQFNSHNLMPYVFVKNVFQESFERLVELGDPHSNRNGNCSIHFNRSSEIFTNPNCTMNMKVVYRLMALILVDRSIILNDHTVKLNREGLTMFSSCPEHVRSWKKEGMSSETLVNFMYHDHFTPPSGKELSKGIDPVLAKQLLMHLDHDEGNTLFSVLMEPVIPDDDDVLKRCLQKFKSDTDSGRKIRGAYGLLCDMGEAIEKKFGPFLSSCWLELADGDDQIPLIKEVEEVIIEQATEEDLVEWEIDIESFRRVDPSFAQMILESQAHYKRIWSNMSQQLLVKPYAAEQALTQMNGANFKNALREQFYVWYQMLDGHYCLFSALCAITLSDPSQFTAKNVTKIHHAMANYLDKPEVAERFGSLIQSQHQMSVAQYQAKLRKIFLNEFLGETEIAIFAHLMGVRLILFFPEDKNFSKTKLDEYGLQTPISSLNYFGPNTKERLYLTYQTTGQNYYYTFPRLKNDALRGDAGDSVKKLNHYWNTVRHNTY